MCQMVRVPLSLEHAHVAVLTHAALGAPCQYPLLTKEHLRTCSL